MTGIQRGTLRQADVFCTKCGAAFGRLELVSLPNQGWDFRCPICSELLESFSDAEVFVAYRLTVSPQKKKPGAAIAPGKLGAAGLKELEALASKQ